MFLVVRAQRREHLCGEGAQALRARAFVEQRGRRRALRRPRRAGAVDAPPDRQRRRSRRPTAGEAVAGSTVPTPPEIRRSDFRRAALRAEAPRPSSRCSHRRRGRPARKRRATAPRSKSPSSASAGRKASPASARSSDINAGSAAVASHSSATMQILRRKAMPCAAASSRAARDIVKSLPTAASSQNVPLFAREPAPSRASSTPIAAAVSRKHQIGVGPSWYRRARASQREDRRR